MSEHSKNIWLDKNLYPFQSRFFHTKNGKMHYIDEGQGQTILFVHGTPTWSFLYREYIKDLSSSYRCIAIDHLGFGLSDKPNIDYKAENLSKDLLSFIEQMDLQNVILVALKSAQSYGYDVVKQDTIIDNHFFQRLEQKEEKMSFVRVDSNTADKLIDKDENRESVLSEKQQEKVKEILALRA